MLTGILIPNQVLLEGKYLPNDIGIKKKTVSSGLTGHRLQVTNMSHKKGKKCIEVSSLCLVVACGRRAYGAEVKGLFIPRLM